MPVLLETNFRTSVAEPRVYCSLPRGRLWIWRLLGEAPCGMATQTPDCSVFQVPVAPGSPWQGGDLQAHALCFRCFSLKGTRLPSAHSPLATLRRNHKPPPSPSVEGRERPGSPGSAGSSQCVFAPAFRGFPLSSASSVHLPAQAFPTPHCTVRPCSAGMREFRHQSRLPSCLPPGLCTCCPSDPPPSHPSPRGQVLLILHASSRVLFSVPSRWAGAPSVAPVPPCVDVTGASLPSHLFSHLLDFPPAPA